MKRLAYRNGSEIGFVDFKEIVFIEKIQNKTIIHTRKREIETYESLNSIYEKLDQEIFIRTHRSYIVNINFIKKIIPWGQKSYRIIFEAINKDALFSYERYKEFKNKICNL